MLEIPLEVSLSERIVRGICHPYHLRNGKLHWNAFWPPPTSNCVSVIRHDYVGSKFCKQKAKSLGTNGKTYRGLAFFHRAMVVNSGSDVVDSRGEYPGHADVVHPYFAPPRGEPRGGKELLALTDICKKLAKFAVYVQDPDPEHDEWLPEPVMLPPPK